MCLGDDVSVYVYVYVSHRNASPVAVCRGEPWPDKLMPSAAASSAAPILFAESLHSRRPFMTTSCPDSIFASKEADRYLLSSDPAPDSSTRS